VSKKVLWVNGRSTGAKMGKPRRTGVGRYPGGQIIHEDRGERPGDIVAVVTSQRAKDVGPEHAAKYEAGFELGKAYLRGYITRQQLKAGEQWALDVDRYCRLHGYPSPFPKAPDYLGVRGAASGYEPDPELIRVVSNTYMQATTAIGKHGRQCQLACRSICIEDMDPRAWPFHTWQALRLGLSSLAGLYNIQELEEKSEEAA
jgi:hypothetical protein